MKTLDSCPFEEPVGKYEIENDKPMMTNEEWLRSCSFNELARVLYCMIINGERIRPDLGYIKRWLKEKHNDL